MLSRRVAIRRDKIVEEGNGQKNGAEAMGIWTIHSGVASWPWLMSCSFQDQ